MALKLGFVLPESYWGRVCGLRVLLVFDEVAVR